MNPDIKAKWIAALESGEYIHGHGVLRSLDNKYCCLGVLCDLYHKETGKGVWIDESHKLNRDIYTRHIIPRYSFEVESTKSDVYLPDAVRSWLGIPLFEFTLG